MYCPFNGKLQEEQKSWNWKKSCGKRMTIFSQALCYTNHEYEHIEISNLRIMASFTKHR